MKIKAFLKRDKNGNLFTNTELKEIAQKVNGFGWQDIYQFCAENDFAGVIRQNGKISLTTTESYRQAL